jgi:hypothetical protein
LILSPLFHSDIHILYLNMLQLFFQLFVAQAQREEAKEREEETQAQTQEKQIRPGQETGQRQIEAGIQIRIGPRPQFRQFESESR